IPPVPGLEKVSYLTSASILDLREVPAHLAIIGGSYIALEFGQLYRRLGSQVTIIEEHDQFLPKEDDDVAAEIRKILEEDGIRIYTSTKVTRVVAGNPVRLDLTESPGAGNKPRPAQEAENKPGQAPDAGRIPPPFLTASHVLVAAGRRPDTAGLNTAAAGIRLGEKGSIAVNGKLETNVPGIFALGDVTGGPQFTHVSYNDHLIVSRNLLDHADLSTDDRLPLYCLFTDPELGRVGLTEREARAKGMEIKVACMPAAHVARAFENSETRGLLKVIAGARDGKILGAAMLITGGGELMSIVQMAMAGGLTTDKVRDMMYAHPTIAESLNNLFAKL
ncbi:MAG TPA: FAD-dependent oxidoreductase, partial [Puia sp.]|nr:FAD-dependent oxidoreductase [Puia sp.]